MDQPPTQGTAEPIQPTVIAGNKRSLSKKQKTGLLVGGFVALLGIISLGSWYYSDVVLNAAGEESLGSNVSISLPSTNDSPYFKVAWVAQQDVGILPIGEAADCWMTRAVNHKGCDFASGWRIEQSVNPSDEGSWKEVYVPSSEAANTATSCGVASGTWPETDIDPILPVLSTSARRTSHGSGTGCPMILGSMSYANDALLRPGTDYYFRISKKVTTTDESGSTSSIWQPQGSAVAVRTKSYPQLTFTQNKNQLVFSWTASQGLGSHNEDYEFTILRSKNPADFTDTSIKNWDEVREKQTNNRGLYSIDVNRAPNADYPAGQKTITQDANSVYYYALAIWDGGYNDGGVVYLPLSKVYVANTDAATSTAPIVNMTVAPLSVPANKLDTIKLTASLKDSCSERCHWFVYNKTRLNNYPNGASDRGIDAYPSSNDDPNISVSNDLRSVTMSPISSRSSKNSWNNVTDAIPGSYTLESEFTVATDAVQTVKTPITLTKVAPNLSASFKAASIKYKTDVVINIKNSYPENYSILPSGKLIIKNINTKKILKEINLSDYQTSSKITLKGVKKGKYKLAVIFQAESKRGVFENQTINLPQLTVK